MCSSRSLLLGVIFTVVIKMWTEVSNVVTRDEDIKMLNKIADFIAKMLGISPLHKVDINYEEWIITAKVPNQQINIELIKDKLNELRKADPQMPMLIGLTIWAEIQHIDLDHAKIYLMLRFEFG